MTTTHTRRLMRLAHTAIAFIALIVAITRTSMNHHHQVHVKLMEPTETEAPLLVSNPGITGMTSFADGLHADDPTTLSFDASEPVINDPTTLSFDAAEPFFDALMNGFFFFVLSWMAVLISPFLLTRELLDIYASNLSQNPTVSQLFFGSMFLYIVFVECSGFFDLPLEDAAYLVGELKESLVVSFSRPEAQSPSPPALMIVKQELGASADDSPSFEPTSTTRAAPQEAPTRVAPVQPMIVQVTCPVEEIPPSTESPEVAELQPPSPPTRAARRCREDAGRERVEPQRRSARIAAKRKSGAASRIPTAMARVSESSNAPRRRNAARSSRGNDARTVEPPRRSARIAARRASEAAPQALSESGTEQPTVVTPPLGGSTRIEARRTRSVSPRSEQLASSSPNPASRPGVPTRQSIRIAARRHVASTGTNSKKRRNKKQSTPDLPAHTRRIWSLDVGLGVKGRYHQSGDDRLTRCSVVFERYHCEYPSCELKSELLPTIEESEEAQKVE